MTTEYDINLDDKYGQLAVIDIAAEAAAHEPWFNQTLTSVNDAVVRLGVIEGDFHWHQHDAEDEFFLVLEGELVIELEGADIVRLSRGTRCRWASATRRARRSAPSSSWSSRRASSPQVTELQRQPVARPPSPGRPLRGSCLCGGVRFEITKPFRRANHCHCSRCQKHSGTFGETQGRVPRDGFRLLQGDELIRVFRPEDGSAKAFCSTCGSSLFGGTWPEGSEVSVRLGALDDDAGIRPQYHSFVGSRAPWDVLPEDGLPRYESANPDADPSPSATP